MGLSFSRERQNEDFYRRSNVKLQAQTVPTFNGDPHKWQTWKKKARAAIGTAGLLRILDEAEYASSHRLENETIFLLLQVATTEGNASFLVDQFDDDRDGRLAYEALEKWFEGMKLQNETAEDIRAKLDKNILSTKVTATKYINLFLSYTKQLKDLDESYTKSKTISLFLEKITDPDYQTTVEMCQAHKYDIQECIMQVRSKERRLEREQEGQKKKTITVRKSSGISQIIEEKKSEESNHMIDISDFKTELGYYSIPKEVWTSLSNQDKTKIKEMNMTLRKKRKATDQGNKGTSPSISNRRNAHVNTDEENTQREEPNKRQRVVHFEDEEQTMNGPNQDEGENTQEINNRRGILRFNLKSSSST